MVSAGAISDSSSCAWWEPYPREWKPRLYGTDVSVFRVVLDMRSVPGLGTLVLVWCEMAWGNVGVG